MPLLIFIIMYITGVMLGFTRYSNIRGLSVNAFFRFLMFMKMGRGTVFIHVMIFQVLNLLLVSAVVILYIILSENEMATVYNIYKWISVALFATVLIASAVDAAVLERNGKGNNDENN